MSIINFIHGDALTELAKLPENQFQLIYTSPPYNIGKEYEKSVITWQEYMEYMQCVINECHRIITHEGSIVFQLGNWVYRGRKIPLDVKFFPLFEDVGFCFQNRIIWHYNWGHHCNRRFSGRYESCLWFTKNRKYRFNLDPVRVPTPHSKKQNKPGKNPTDFWEADCFEEELVFTPNITRNNPEKMDHPCQSPLKLIDRFVLCLTDKGDKVLDPFGGVGSVVVSSLMNGREGWMIEKEKKYIEQAMERIEKENGSCLAA